MNPNARRITALLLILLLTGSLLVSCSGREEEIADIYLAEKVDLGLSENEYLFDVIEVDGELRATVGVTSEEVAAKYGTDYGIDFIIPYQTEYRYYTMDFLEDTAKRETTAPFFQIAQVSDPSMNLVIGGEPYLYTDENGTETSYGIRYYLYQDGEKLGEVLNPLGENNYGKYTQYSAKANLAWVDDTPYVWMNYDGFEIEVFVKDRFLKTTEIAPGVSYNICGLMEIGETPYILICAKQYDLIEEYSWFENRPLWEKTLLVPLTPETTELTLEGIEIEGEATGGVCSDGTYGYYMCGSELWRTDGKTSGRISELIFCGVNDMSDVRTIRSLSDGRLLVVADGGLIALSESESSVPAERKVYTLAVMNGGYVPDLSLIVAKFNALGKDCIFVVKEYKDVTKLNLALLSGEVDVIVTADQFALRNYIKQDLLVPLEELIPELFEEGVLLENIVNASRINGICYYLPREFQIQGRLMEYRLLEDGIPFETPQEYYDFVLENDPRYLKSIEKKGLITHLAPTVDEWVDWENNRCHFDDGSFEALLEFCNEAATFQTMINHDPSISCDEPSYSGGLWVQNLMYYTNFAVAESAKEYVESLPNGDPDTLPDTNQEAWAWVAHPLPSRVYDGFEISIERFFAVVDKEESREAAGEFLRWHFLENVVGEIAPDDPEEDYEDFVLKGVYEYSINQAECERYVGRNLSWDGEDKETRLPLEQRRYEDTWQIIRQADHFQNYQNVIFDVMVEEAYRYFDGDITASQAAEYTQNRISLYLAEQS